MDSRETTGTEPAQDTSGLMGPAEDGTEETSGQKPAEGTAEDTAEDSQATAEDESPERPKKRKKSVQERIDELTYRWRQTERELEYWRNLALQHMQVGGQTAPQAEGQKVVFDKPRPKPEEFDSQEAYEDALFQWWEAKRQAEIQARSETEKITRLAQDFMQRASKFREEHPDFDLVIQSPVYTDTMREVILQSEEGPQLAYYLGLPENRMEAERIANMPPLLQVKELGKLAAKLSKPTKKTSEAPPPINPVKGAGGPVAKNPDEMSIEEWMRWRREQLRKQRR